MERFNLLVVQPEDYVNYAPFLGPARSIYYALRRLGYETRFSGNRFLHDETNIVVGAHHLDVALAATLPAGTIVYNTEQLRADNEVAAGLRPFVSRFETWDHSLANIELWRAMGLAERVRYVRPGYVVEDSTVDLHAKPDIDVLFFGNVNPRRVVVLDALRRAGIALHVADGVYLEKRDALAARAKIVLNIHAADDSSLEMARVAYALGNRRALVTELGRRAVIDADLRDGVAAGPVEALPGLCRQLLDDDEGRLALAARGFEAFTKRDLARNIKEVLALRPSASAGL